MEFHTFYDYFLFTKSWAYVMMFIVLPLYVLYWNFVLFPDKKKGNNSPKRKTKAGPQGSAFFVSRKPPPGASFLRVTRLCSRFPVPLWLCCNIGVFHSIKADSSQKIVLIDLIARRANKKGKASFAPPERRADGRLVSGAS